MKKIVCLAVVFIIIVSLTGCGSDTGASEALQESAVGSDGPETEIVVADAETVTDDEPVAEESGPEEKVDIDLTKLSSTMVYSEVYNMMTVPEEYVGKTIKMTGQFALYQATDENGEPVPDQIYFACVIADATACCQQGLEFVLAGDYTYPDDYPELGEEITVAGEFQTYMEGDAQFCHLVDSYFC